MSSIVSNNCKEIVYVLESTGLYGGVKIVFEHVNRLHDMGYKVHLFALEGQPNWFPLKIQIRSFNSYQEMLGVLKNMDAIKIATWWDTLNTVLQSCNQNLGGRGIPFYFVQDIEDSYYPKDPEGRGKVLQTYQTNVNFLTESVWTTQQLKDRFHKEASNVSIAIDLDLYKPNRSNNYKPFQILAISRNSQHIKGFGVTEEAVKKVYQKLKNISFMTFGIESPNIILVPSAYLYRPNDQIVASLYANCGVFVQTSNHEGFGLPILEAMASGAPVVTTKAEGNEEFCVNGYNCLMVDKGDVNGVANAIYKVLTDRDFSNYISQNGVKTAQKYNWENVEENLDNVFRKYCS